MLGLDLPLHRVQGADEGQRLAGLGRIAGLALDELPPHMGPAPQMTFVAMNRVVACVAIGLQEATVAVEEPGRVFFTATGGQVEDGVRLAGIARVKPGIGGALGRSRVTGLSSAWITNDCFTRCTISG